MNDAAFGAVNVTTFYCRSRATLVLLRVMHLRIARDTRGVAPSLVGMAKTTNWRERQLRSLTCWSTPSGMLEMGMVKRHIVATKVLGRLGVEARSQVFTASGTYRDVFEQAVKAEEAAKKGATHESIS